MEISSKKIFGIEEDKRQGKKEQKKENRKKGMGRCFFFCLFDDGEEFRRSERGFGNCSEKKKKNMEVSQCESKKLESGWVQMHDKRNVQQE